MKVRQASSADRNGWLEMRELLWPDHGSEHLQAIESYFAGEAIFIDQVFVCEDQNSELAGFIELRLRNYAEGSDAATVPFVEGWFVRPDYRRRNVGRLLMAGAEQWALALGFCELGSDTETDNQDSIDAHLALGFTEVERSVSFLKSLPTEPDRTD